MRKSITSVAVTSILLILLTFTTLTTHAQTRIAYISMSGLIQALPEYKKADSALNNYQNALSQEYQEMVSELNQKSDSLSSPDTIHQTREQIEVRKREAAELYNRVQNFPQQENQLLQERQEELLTPLRKKASDLVSQVARQRGYTYVFLKETMAVYPPADDLMPYALNLLSSSSLSRPQARPSPAAVRP